MTAILICLLLIAAIVMTLVALVMRTIALLLLIVLLPLTLAGTAGPKIDPAVVHLRACGCSWRCCWRSR